MKKFLLQIQPLSFLLLMFLFSCGSEADKKNPDDKTIQKDSVSTNLSSNENSETEKLFSHFKPSDSFPVVVDSAFIAGVRSGDSLGTREVKQLAGKWFDKTEFSNPSYSLKTFYMIDSVKATGTFEKWADSLTIGDTKYSNAYAVQQLKLNEHVSILTWAITYQSYEACPYSEGTEIYYSVFIDGIISETFLLGEEMSGADAPVSMHRIVTGTMSKDGKITLDVYEEGDDGMEVPTIDITKEHYELSLTDGKTTLILVKKEKPKTVKREDRN